MPIRTLVADAHPIARIGLTTLLSDSEFEVVSQAANYNQVIQCASICSPDVILLDLRIPGGDALKAARRIKKKQPGTRIIVSNVVEDVGVLVRAYQQGTDGYITKNVSQDALLAEMRRVMKGKGWNRKQLRQVATAQRYVYHFRNYLSLTDRELEVLSLVIQGAINQEIAEILDVNRETVKRHIKRLLSKLGVANRAQVVVWVLSSSLPWPQ